MKFGPCKGNSKAIFRYGENLDNGIWIAPLSIFGFRFRKKYIRLGFLTIMWGN